MLKNYVNVRTIAISFWNLLNKISIHASNLHIRRDTHGREKPCSNEPEQSVDVSDRQNVVKEHMVNVMEHFAHNTRVEVNKIPVKAYSLKKIRDEHERETGNLVRANPNKG